jgi:hypothetical protein
MSNLEAPLFNPPSEMPNIFLFGNARPRDPNGIDVMGELPLMRKAFAQTHEGRDFRGRAEAGYSIFNSNGNLYHSGVVMAPESHLSIPTNPGTMAVVHTHPVTGDPYPSPGDRKSKVPNYVFSGNTLYVTDPKTERVFKYDISKWNGLTPPR